jgi:hypothetical protein
MLEDVDDLDLIAPIEILFAKPPEVGDGALGSRRLACYVKLQQVAFQVVRPFVLVLNLPAVAAT